MKPKLILPAITLFCSLAATAVAQSPTPSPSPSPAESQQPSPTPQTSPKPTKLRVSQGVEEGLLIHRVKPKYPAEAKAKHIQGDVLMKMTVNATGEVESLERIWGDPLLVNAAMDAVKQWKYRPYLLNGEPIAVETTVKISFQM